MHSIYLNQFGIVLNSTYAILPSFFEIRYIAFISFKKKVIYIIKSPFRFIYFLQLYQCLLMLSQFPEDLSR